MSPSLEGGLWSLVTSTFLQVTERLQWEAGCPSYLHPQEGPEAWGAPVSAQELVFPLGR